MHTRTFIIHTNKLNPPFQGIEVRPCLYHQGPRLAAPWKAGTLHVFSGHLDVYPSLRFTTTVWL